MPWMPGCPQDPTPGHGALDPIAVVLHRTYGGWGGDYSVGKQGLFQFLIGKDEGRWVQFMPSDQIAFHCNGGNFRAFGIEIEGTNDDALTPWQEARLGDILRWANEVHGIPLTYLDPGSVPRASVRVNAGSFRGLISHVSVATDDGSSQHTDEIAVSAVAVAVGNPQLQGDDEVTPEQMSTIGTWLQEAEARIEKKILDTLGAWEGDTRRQIIAHIDAAVASLKP